MDTRPTGTDRGQICQKFNARGLIFGQFQQLRHDRVAVYGTLMASYIKLHFFASRTRYGELKWREYIALFMRTRYIIMLFTLWCSKSFLWNISIWLWFRDHLRWRFVKSVRFRLLRVYPNPYCVVAFFPTPFVYELLRNIVVR